MCVWSFLVCSEIPKVDAVSGDRGDHEAEGDHPEQASQAALETGRRLLVKADLNNCLQE